MSGVSKLKLIFLGTPAFAVPSLEAVLAAGHEVPIVVTQPDRPKGRGHRPAYSPVKSSAAARGLPVLQPERIRRPEAIARLAELRCDAMVLVGYGQIVPQSVIDLTPLGIVNVHASLLPRYRGAAPVQWAIVHGETITGVTTMRIDAGLDTGDMLLKAETPIDPDENALVLSERLAAMGAKLLIETLDGLEHDRIVPEKQDAGQATYAPILKKEDGRIDWSLPAQAIHNRVRGLQPWPGAYTRFRGASLSVWKTAHPAAAVSGEPGTMRSVGGLHVACGGGTTLRILEVQMEGRKKISGEAFANGQRLAGDDMLGG